MDETTRPDLHDASVDPAPTVRVGDRRFGAGCPAITVPVMGRGVDELVAAVARAATTPADLLEWRVDHLEGAEALADDVPALRDLVRRVTRAAGGTPLLATYRTRGQGGEGDASPEQYLALLGRLVEAGGVDLLDVEFDHPHRDGALAQARATGVPTLVSHHDWDGQPEATELLGWVDRLRATGADAVKLATAPADVTQSLALLEVLERCSRSGQPLAMLGMGAAGQSTRLVGPTCGSLLTFAHAGEASAPGQLAVELVAATVGALRGPNGSA
ncbi:type I 3-dehydroquinate dehydratase [Kytococcus sp. Marseille-QA3725]